jgi:thiol-disulfide isomerase/thioredoxin
MKSSKIILITLILIISSFITVGSLSDSYINSSYLPYKTNLLDVGTVGKDWTLKDILTDNSITFSSFSGKVIVMDFFATWCVPCQESMAEFATLKNSFSSSELVIISVCAETIPETTVENFASNFNMNWKIVIDDFDLPTHYEVSNIPTIYIFDTTLKIHYRNAGSLSAASMTSIVNSILNPSSTPQPSGSPSDGFWSKNWYWFGIALVFIIVGISVYVQRRKVIEHNKKVREARLKAARKKNLKKRR